MSAPTGKVDGRSLRAKYPGTGMLDTPLEAWAALFRDYMAAGDGRPLSDPARRLGIRYSAAVEKARREGWQTLREVVQAPTPGWIRIWQSFDGGRAHAALEAGSSYLAAALALAPPPEPWEPDAGAERSRPWEADVDVRAPVVDLVAYRRTLH